MGNNKLKFDESGLIPVVVQDSSNGQVLMVAYANKEALDLTLETKRTHFWSRSREKPWAKGEESGNTQSVKEIFLDCDGDTVLAVVEQKGVACHTGRRSCFFETIEGSEKEAPAFGSSTDKKTLDEVYQVIEDRKRNPRPGSYVASLFEGGLDKILKKIGEEAGEVIIAAKSEKREETIHEVADLWFHSLVMLAYFDIKPNDIYEELGRRFGKKKSDNLSHIP